MTQKFQTVAIGELLWDVFPDQQRLGGAPANVAIHLSQLAQLAGAGGDVSLISAVGDDELGADALRQLEDFGVDTRHVSVSANPTGQVIVTLTEDNTPSYQIAADAAWDQLAWSDASATLAASVDLVYFGTLAQRSPTSRSAIENFVGATSQTCLRILDINLRPTMDDQTVIEQSLNLANVLKLSDEELPVLANQFSLDGDAKAQLQQLQQRFALDVIAYTLGADGAIMMRGEETVHCVGYPTTIADTVGAGDAFTAAMGLGLLHGNRLQDIVDSACQIAALVCAYPGATPRISPNT